MLPAKLAFLARRTTAAAVVTIVAAPVLVTGQATTTASGTPVTESSDAPAVIAPITPVASTVKVGLLSAVKNLRVASETPAGYDRDKYRHWIDANADCQDTRDEVLKAESRTRISGCDIRTGRWFSYYDRKTWRSSSDVDIDHLVPLKESWDSGAKRWNADTRKRYANDLGDRRSLVAVTDNVNQSKSDRDPADWMPRYGKCRYVKEWTAVKIRWGLKVDRAEKTKLVKVASNCRSMVLTVAKARVVRSTTGGGTTGGSSGGTDPQFSYCYQAKAAGYGPYYKGQDAEYWWYTDSDSDGVVCE